MLPIVKKFLELVTTPVQSRDERAIADLLTAKLQALDFEVAEDDAGALVGGNTGNLIARLKGDKTVPSILFSAHMDRVKNSGNIQPIVSGNKITSDESTILAADDVAGITVILNGIRMLLAENIPHGDIEIVFSICEEQGVLGSRFLNYSRLHSKIAYVFDAPGKVGRIINRAPAKCKIKAVVHGKSAHAGNEPEKGLNAIKVAAAALTQIPDGRLSKQSTANFGSIHGGASTNVVCDSVEIIGEARSTDDQELKQYLDTMQKTFNEVAKQYQTTIDVQIEKFYDTFYVSEETEAARLIKRALRTLEIEAQFTPGGGGMDANNFNTHGIQALGFASGYSNNHTNNESVYIDELVLGAKAVKAVIQERYQASKAQQNYK